MSEYASPGIQQVETLPISGSGGQNSSAIDKLNNVSITLAATSLQAAEDSKYDPKVISGTPVIIRPGEGFCSPLADVSSSLIMISYLLCMV